MKNLLIKTAVVGGAWAVGRSVQFWWDEWGYDSRPVKYIKTHKVEVAVAVAVLALAYKSDIVDKI